MNPLLEKRRRFIKASLVIPLLSNLPWNIPTTKAMAYTLSGAPFQIPENVYHVLFMIYGGLANAISRTDRLVLKAPDIAENGAVVGVRVSGERGLVSSMAILVAQNLNPLTSTCRLHEGADLAVGLRIKLEKTSDIYVVAQTQNGLVGVMKTVKVTIGCGGF